MVVVVELPFEQDATTQLQDLIDGELGVRTAVVKRTQLVGAGAIGYRFHAVVEELPDYESVPA